MITIQGVSADSQYFSKDDYYIKNANIKPLIFNEKVLKDLGINTEIIKQERMFNSIVESGIGSKKMVGQDLTFSAPKSVSVLATTGNAEQQQIAIRAHNEAVKQTLEYINKNSIYTRKTENGVTKHVKGTDITSINFTHFTNRNLDPDLHTHAVVLNTVRRETDGERRAIDFKKTLRGVERKNLDVMYKTTLANILQKERIAVKWDKDGKNFEIKGIDKKVIDAFSTRKKDVLEYAKKNNLDLSNQTQREKAILNTRKSKTKKQDLKKLQENWREKAKENGLKVENNKIVTETPAKTEKKDINAVINLVNKNFNLDKGVFSKTEYLSEALKIGNANNQEINVKTVEKKFNAMLKNREIIKLKGEKFTTKEYLKLEEHITNAVKNKHSAIISEQEFREHINEFKKDFKEKHGFWLSKEQEAAFRDILTNDRQFTAVQGYAGTGKSASFLAFREFLQKYKNNVKIRGATPTGKSAEVLEGVTGIKSYTVNSFLNSLEKKDTQKQNNSARESAREIKQEWHVSETSTSNDVWIVDEASMLSTKIASEIIKAAEAKKVKIVFVGDVKQLAAAGAGKPYSLMQEAGIKTNYITDIRRQKKPELKNVAKWIARGKVKEAWNSLKESGKIISITGKDEQESKKQVKKMIVDDFVKKYKEDKNTVILAYTNAEVESLNNTVRSMLADAGVIDKSTNIPIKITIKQENIRISKTDKNVKYIIQKEKTETKEFAVGDKIMFLKNDNGVKNGEVGIIREIKQEDKKNNTLKIEKENGKEVKINTKEYNSFTHAYAITVHKSQGTTVRNVYAYMDGKNHINTNVFYVAVTRASQDFRAYVVNTKNVEEKITKQQEKETAIKNIQAEQNNKIQIQAEQNIDKDIKQARAEGKAQTQISLSR